LPDEDGAHGYAWMKELEGGMQGVDWYGCFGEGNWEARLDELRLAGWRKWWTNGMG
jgi:hypothetical protein